MPDVIVDFGRELYVPWRITEGSVLYRDIASFNGPLSYYWLALWYRCFGVSLYSIVIANLIAVAAAVWLLHQLMVLIAGRGAAMLSCITFLGLFAFAHLLPTGNYNWICPYSHELPHGALLSLVSIYLWSRFLATGRARWILAAGFTLGLVFLTKAEVFLAALSAHLAAMAALLWLDGSRFQIRIIFLWSISLVVAPGASWVLLAQAMGAGDALQGTLGSWPYVFQLSLRELFYFKWHAGLLDPTASILSILVSAGAYALILVPVSLLAIFLNRRLPGRAASDVAKIILPAIVFLGVAASLAVLWLKCQWINWGRMAQPWPLFTLLVVCFCAWKILRNGSANAERRMAVTRLTLAMFSFVLLGRMILNTRLSHYGFVLAMPATMLVLAAAWEWIPQWVIGMGGNPTVIRAAVLGGWTMILVAHASISNHFMAAKTHIVGTAADSLKVDEIRGDVLLQVVEYLAQHAQRGDTLAVLPEGVILNYWLRLPSSTPFVEYHPPALLMYGEEAMLRSLQRRPPDWIVLVHRDHWEYGASFLGHDYGQALATWIDRRYSTAALFGAPPFRTNEFGILIGKQRPIPNREF